MLDVMRCLMLCSAGVDAARAFGTGCFQVHRTHDTRGMSESELRVRIPGPTLQHGAQSFVES